MSNLKQPYRAGEIFLAGRALNEYLSLRSDDKADLVYKLFRPFNYEGPQVFTNVAAKALKMFATEKKLRNFFRFKSDDGYFILCALLQNVITFCSDISRREANGIYAKIKMGDRRHFLYVFRGYCIEREEL
jgi:hypothetical protein